MAKNCIPIQYFFFFLWWYRHGGGNSVSITSSDQFNIYQIINCVACTIQRDYVWIVLGWNLVLKIRELFGK